MKITVNLFATLLLFMAMFGFSLSSLNKKEATTVIAVAEEENQSKQPDPLIEQIHDIEEQVPGACYCLESLCWHPVCRFCPGCAANNECCSEKCKDTLGCFISSSGSCFSSVICDYGP